MSTIKALITQNSTSKRTPKCFPFFNGCSRGSQAGFTLIEIILSLILVGILAAMGGTVIVHVVKGYMALRENTTMTQKSQLAMSRITREIIEMINLPSDATATALPIKNVNGNRTIGLDQGAVKIAFGADTLANGDILIDNVSAFTLTYYSRSASSGAVTTSSTWPAANDITTLTSIDINLQISRAGGDVLTFVNRVAPRNNKNQGGAAPSVPPPSAPQYGSCFIVTAAYGDPAHPLVQIPRDFRDRYLLNWSGGRWLVSKYNELGPAAADLIRDRPLARWFVRGLLAPVVAVGFFMIYAPLAIPLTILISLILTGALFSAVRRGIKPLGSNVSSFRGSVMIGLIVTMAIMATLSAAMLPMFSASNANQVYAEQGRKVYFLAESGFRYAASQFLNASTETAKLAAMTTMNNKTCNLLDNAGSFAIKVYPYWFKSQAASAGATTLATQVYGTIPAEFTGSFSSGQIRVGASYHAYSSGSGSGTAITFSGLSPALPLIPATPQLDVQPVTQPASAVSLSKGGSLTLSAIGSGVFPLINGNFVLDPAPAGVPQGAVFNYDQRSGSTLSNITLSDGTLNQNWSSTLSIPATTRVVLDKFIRLSSTGAIGGVSREVLYNVPVGWIAGGGTDFIKGQDIDPMNTAANWLEPTGGGGGTHSVQTVDGGSALKVDSVASSGGWWTSSGSWAMTFFRGYSNTNLAKSWLDAQGSLSYDLQVKVHNPQPYFFAGMNFRARNNSDNTDLYSYGVSLIKPRQTRGCIIVCGDWGAPSDLATALIPGYVSDTSAGPLFSNPGLFANLEQTTQPFIGTQARYGLPAVVLWKRTAAGFRWLAYRTLTTADGIVDAPGSPANALRLRNWSTLLVRVAEGYPLTFSNGGGTSGVGTPIKEGDIVETLDMTSSARVVMTPILTGGSWASRNAAGTLVLANVVAGTTPIANNTPLHVNSVQRAVATSAIVSTKRNYLRVYYGRPTAQGTANAIQTDNNRLANPRNSVNWPPDDLTELVASNDYFTLVQWTGYNGISAFTSTSEPNAIIVDSDLTTPTWTATSTLASFLFPNGNSGDNLSLTTSSSAGTSTSYDDFAIQLDQKAGAGFLPPIQQ